uniref:Uncharacterized protein n=1 Tax=Neogobius melanostomus TaxID=47308 RepID=A0A8C6TIT3_9GOBI
TKIDEDTQMSRHQVKYGTQKTKRTHKSSGDQGKERRRLSHQSNSFEDDPKAAEARTEEDGSLAQGGLRRFKTIELNNTNSYNRDIELSTEHDLREPELEMESLTGTPEERSKGDYSSTLPATTPSYNSGTSPTSVSSMEDDSDSSPSRRARLEEAKQQRKARHRAHGPLLPTIEDSSEEDELREEEELLREQEQMRDLEQQRIRSTARKAKRDKEELRAQRRRERSKTPPSNLSPIEDASPTEELRQAAEMEELHRSSCSEYSPSMDSEAEGFEGIAGKLYKSGNEYNLPTLTTLYSPTEKNAAVSPSDKTLKSAEEVYEEMMRKAQIMQRQGHTVQQKGTESKSTLDPGEALTPGSSPTQIAAPVSTTTSATSSTGFLCSVQSSKSGTTSYEERSPASELSDEESEKNAAQPPPEETPLPIVTPAQMYSSPGMSQRVLPRSAQGVTKAGLLYELKAVEQESSKLRKQQAELEEEEKEIDAKLRCLELGITQRKETMVKERERRDLAYVRCMGDGRDYMSDSELNNLRMAAATGTFDANGLLTRPSTAPLSQFTNDPNATSQYPSTSSYMSYPYSQSQSPATAYGFQTHPYPTSAPQPGTFQPHPPTGPLYPNQASYSTRGYSLSSFQTDLGMQQHSHQGFHPSGQPMASQSLPYPSSSYQPGLPYQQQADILTVHQRPRQTSLADLEQKLPTNYEVINNPAVSVATSAPDTSYGSLYSNAYGQYRPPEPGLSNLSDSAMNTYGTDGTYTSNLEQNIPRNYVMIDDISELTKDNTGQTTDALGHPVGDVIVVRMVLCMGLLMEGLKRRLWMLMADQQGRLVTRALASYYYDDYKHGTRSSSGSHKSTPKNLTPGFSSKRSKHRKQGIEQKISKFSPIEEARDVESDLASYTMTTSTGGSCTVVTRSKKGQEDANYGKRHSYDQQKYYGTSREGLEEEDHMYTSGRSRSTGYGMDKISSRDNIGHRSKSYERDAMERSQRSSRSGRPPMRNQNSEEESPLSPVGKPVGIGRSSAAADAYDARNQYGSSHSLPDVQDHHKKDLPRSHVYKPDDPYLVDDMHCAVSDSEGNWC